MTDDSTLPQNGPCFSLAFSADGEWLITRDGVHRYMTENEKSLVFEMARELYDRFVMGGWEPKDAYGQIAELITRYGEIINTNAPLPPPQARRPDSPTKILIALIQHGYCPNCGCDQWNTAGCPICPVMRQSYDFLVTAGIKEPRNYAEYMAADPINQQNMAESAPQEAGALTVKQAHTICEQLCFHVAVHGGEGNPFKGMKWDWFADLAAPELIELLRAASECGIPLPDEAKNLSDLLCPPHANLDKNNHLEPFDNCIACIRNERDELRQLLLRISTDIGQTIIEDPIKSAEGWTLLSKPVLADIAAVFEMDRRGVPLEEK